MTQRSSLMHERGRDVSQKCVCEAVLFWISAAGRSQPWEVCLWTTSSALIIALVLVTAKTKQWKIFTVLSVWLDIGKKTSLMRSSLCFICFSEQKWDSTEMSFRLELSYVSNRGPHVLWGMNERDLSGQMFLVRDYFTFLDWIHEKHLKGIVHPKIKTCWKCAHLQAIRDQDEFVSSSGL